MGNASEVEKPVWRGEAALLLAVIVNSFGVVLMLYSGSGISAISSVPFAFSEVFPQLSLGTWTYIFQGLLIASLMVLRRRFVLQYVFSFAVGFVFGELLDVHELWIGILPDGRENKRAERLPPEASGFPAVSVQKRLYLKIEAFRRACAFGIRHLKPQVQGNGA